MKRGENTRDAKARRMLDTEEMLMLEIDIVSNVTKLLSGVASICKSEAWGPVQLHEMTTTPCTRATENAVTLGLSSTTAGGDVDGGVTDGDDVERGGCDENFGSKLPVPEGCGPLDGETPDVVKEGVSGQPLPS